MNDNELLNKFFQTANEASVQYEYEEIKSNFLENLQKKTRQKRIQNFKKGLIMIGIITTVALLVWQPTAKNVEPQLTTEKTPVQVEKNESTSQNHDLKSSSLHDKRKGTKKDEINLSTLTLQNVFLPIESKIPKIVRRVVGSEKKQIAYPITSKPYIPKLTEDEIKLTNKRKKSMLKDFAKRSSKRYAYIPAGSANLNGQTVSVQAFYMGKTEVSVVEYKTFLFDLLIQGRETDFLIAQPDFEAWVRIAGVQWNSMVGEYFSKENFEYHPINNISREAAEMYCKWLTLETSNAYPDLSINDVRLPTRFEWEYAASGQGKASVYPWSTNSLKNEEGCYLANFHFPFLDGSSTSDSSEVCATVHSNWTYATVPIKSYNPNYLGLWNMAGNVAEMVWNSDLRSDGLNSTNWKPGTAGGGWMDHEEDLKIYAEDKYTEMTDAHPNIGFRVVWSYLGRDN